MPQIVPPGYAKVLHSITLTGDAEPMALTYGVKFVGVEGPPDPGQIATSLRDAFVSSMGGIIATGYMHRQTEVRYPGPGGSVLQGVNAIPANFTGTTNALPQNTAVLAHKRSTVSGRRHRGRFYIPGVNEGEVDAKGLISTALQGAFNTALASWLSTMIASPEVENMVILHSGLQTPGFPPPTLVQQLLCDPIVATQRGRLRK